MKCNVCGVDFKDESRIKGEFYNPELHRFVVSFGYGSAFDYQQWVFHKCDKCLNEEVQKFKVLAEISEYE